MYKLKAYPEDFAVDEILAGGVGASVIAGDPAAQGNFVWFSLKKVNWNTIDLAREIAKRMRVSDTRVNYAGIKDRNAVTYQVFSVATKETAEAVLERISKIKDVQVLSAWRADRWIKSEDMLGNAFEITLRECDFTAQDILKNHPSQFSNYFGEQRFGSLRKSSAAVGLNLLKGDYVGAVAEYFPEEVERAGWEERMYRQSVKLGPERFVRSNWRVFKLCAHAFQSQLFNLELEQRISDNECGVLEGEYACGRNAAGFADVNVEGGEFTVGLLAGSECKSINKYKQALFEKYQISNENFKKMDVRGGYRTLYAPIVNLDAVDAGDKAVRIKFALQKGSYATVLIDELASGRK